MTDLAIIIVSWNVKDLLADCLRSLKADIATSRLSAEVWVVDNASSDGSVAMIEQDFPQVHLIASQKNLGFATGNNLALRALGFETSLQPRQKLPEAILLLNPDTIVHQGALQILSNFLTHNPKVGIVGPRLQYGDGTFQHSAFALPGLWQLTIDLLPVPGRLVESSLNGRYPAQMYKAGTPFEVGHPLGAAMGVRCEAIKQVGLLDETYHMYVEEVDWGKRITAAGWKAYCVPQALITHLGGQSTTQIKIDSFLNLWRSRYYFYKKHYSAGKVWVASQIVRWGMRRKQKQDRLALGNQQLSKGDFAARTAAYQQISDLWQGKSL